MFVGLGKTAAVMFWLCFFRLAAVGRTTIELVAIAETLSALVPRFDDDIENPVDGFERWATLLSPFAFGASCLHRATAGKVWLAMAGVDAEIVVGFRKRDEIEGHAWLEITLPTGGSRTLFSDEADGFQRVDFS